MQENDEHVINDKALSNFKEKWSWHDKHGQGFMKISEFKHFLA